MPSDRDVSAHAIAFDDAIHRLERHPPYNRHIGDVGDRALQMLDAMQRAGFVHAEISDYFKTRVLLVADPEAREAVAGGCARAMTIRYRMGESGHLSPPSDIFSRRPESN